MTGTTEASAAVLRDTHKPMRIEPIAIEPPRADEVLVRIVATGICHTDMVMRDQGLPTPQPVVLGHEGAGIVIAVGAAVTRVVPGDHVVLSFNSCGHCPSCDAAAPAYCHEFFPRNFTGTRPDGSSPLSAEGAPIFGNIFGQSSFATHAIAHERNTVKVPADAPLELLGPLGCGIMTGAGAVMVALDVQAKQSIAIFGTGAVGLSAVMAAKVRDASAIIAIDRNLDRLALARELGATAALEAKAGEPLAERILALTGSGVDYAIDTTANVAVIRSAATTLAPRGTLGLVGASAPGDEIAFDAVNVMSGGRVIRGIVEGSANPQALIPQLVALHLAGRFPFDRLVRFYRFDEIVQAIADAEEGRVVKPIVRMPE